MALLEDEPARRPAGARHSLMSGRMPTAMLRIACTSVDRAHLRDRAKRPRDRGTRLYISARKPAVSHLYALYVWGLPPRDDTLEVRSLGDVWRDSWRTASSENKKTPGLRGFLKYRYGDSNPGFRRERAAS
jgi:hypothetical protein